MRSRRALSAAIVIDSSQGGDSLALEDERGVGIRYLGNRVRSFIRGGKECFPLRQMHEFIEPSIRVGAVYVSVDNEGGINLGVNVYASRRTNT